MGVKHRKSTLKTNKIKKIIDKNFEKLKEEINSNKAKVRTNAKDR